MTNILSAILVLTILNLFLIIQKTKKSLTGKDGTPAVNFSAHQTGFSIIIAAKNESENIPHLINSLLKLEYPQGLFEVIIVDDNSSDETYNLCSAYSSKYDFLKVYRNTETSDFGKRISLNLGISKANNPYILITDADCLPEKKWLNSFAELFNEENEILFGSAPFIREDFFINKASCFENLRNTILSFSLTGIGLPYTAVSRNLGFRKDAFEKIGGYSRTFQSVSGDDDLLIREAVKSKLKIGLVSGEGSFVFSKTKKNLKDYLSQRSRHTQASFHYLFRHQIILGVWHGLNLFFLFSPLLAIIDINFLFLLPSKLIIDLLIVKVNQKKFSYEFKWYEIVYLQICYEVFLIVHFFNAKFRKVKWK